MTVGVRWLVGVSTEAELSHAEAAVLQLQGQGESLRLLQLGSASALLVPSFGREFSSLRFGGELRPIAALKLTWTQQILPLIRAATDRIGVSWSEILCVGLFEPWLALEVHKGSAIGLALPIAATLAELTGWSVASGFALRDLAAGGLGGLVTAAADWLLFHSEQEDRLIVHLGEDITVHWIPRGASWPAMHSAVVLPGLGVLDRLACVLSGGREAADRSGHLAVQGHFLPDLLVRWQAHPALLNQRPTYVSHSAFGWEWVQATSNMARQRGWSALDVMCTACHWLADNITSTLTRLGQPKLPYRVLVTGPGCRNGFLWQLLQEKLRPAMLERSDQFGIPAETAQAIRAALLAALLLDQVPASVPQVNGGSGARLLGQWTPGALANWSRCLRWMTEGSEPIPWEEI